MLLECGGNMVKEKGKDCSGTKQLPVEPTKYLAEVFGFLGLVVLAMIVYAIWVII